MSNDSRKRFVFVCFPQSWGDTEKISRLLFGEDDRWIVETDDPTEVSLYVQRHGHEGIGGIVIYWGPSRQKIDGACVLLHLEVMKIDPCIPLLSIINATRDSARPMVEMAKYLGITSVSVESLTSDTGRLILEALEAQLPTQAP